MGDFVNALVTRMENELEEDFPGWLIHRETSGQWTATRPGWGSLFARTAPELRERLTKHAGQAAPRP